MLLKILQANLTAEVSNILGHTVGQHCVSPFEVKVAAVKTFQQPKTKSKSI